jgi:serine/threonine protein kinase
VADQTPDHPSGPPSYADDARRYRLDSRIASGGMGEVWLGTDTLLDRQVAVKLLKQEHADDAVFRSRFETEAQHAAALHHPGVAQVFDFGAGDHQHRPYLVLEYVDGRPLSAILRPGQPMDASAAAQLIAATADALGAAHAQGIVHRDVKPANILVTDDRQVKITDFGIARAADAVALTGTGEVLGTPQYISPEQAQGRRATPASDVYSLGAVAFECLVGRRPYEADSPVATAIAHLRQPVPELPDTVPPALASVVRRAMAKSPEERYEDGAALATAVRAAERDADEASALVDPDATRILAAPVVGAGVAVGAATGATTAAVASDASGHRRVPVAVWAAAGVLVLVVAVAAVAALTTGTDDPSPGSTTSDPPASRESSATSPSSSQASSPASSPTSSATSGPTSSATSSLTSSPASSATASSSATESDSTAAEDNQGNQGSGSGPGHGHEQGKGHQ